MKIKNRLKYVGGILVIGIILMTIFNDNVLDLIGFFLFFGGVVWVVIIMLRELIKKGKFFGVFQPIFENREY